MTATESQSTFSLDLQHTFSDPRERVFDAWTQPDQLVQWFGSPGSKTTNAEVDLRVGGAYSLTIETAQFGLVRVFGIFREVSAPEKLVYTWCVDPSPGVRRGDRSFKSSPDGQMNPPPGSVRIIAFVVRVLDADVVEQSRPIKRGRIHSPLGTVAQAPDRSRTPVPKTEFLANCCAQPPHCERWDSAVFGHEFYLPGGFPTDRLHFQGEFDRLDGRR